LIVVYATRLIHELALSDEVIYLKQGKIETFESNGFCEGKNTTFLTNMNLNEMSRIGLTSAPIKQAEIIRLSEAKEKSIITDTTRPEPL